MPSDPLHDSPEKVIAQFDDAGPVDLMDLHRGLHEAAGASAGEVWRADLLASEIRPYPTTPSPWGGYFGPRFTAEFENGDVVERPALSEANEEVLATWRGRAETLVAPTLKAHYADLVWDLGPKISAGRREPAFARMAVEAYRAAAADPREQRLHAFSHLSRALTIAIQLDDRGLVDAVRFEILESHRQAVDAGELWWRAYDILSPQRKAGLTEPEKAQLISDLEAALAGYADQGDPKRFDVHFVERTGERLIKHYRQAKLSAEEKRIHAIVARAREHHAARAEALAASSILNDSMDAYRKAGLADDVERVRRLMQAKVREARDQMAEISQEVRVSFDEVEAFQARIIEGDWPDALARIGGEFMLRRADLEAQVASTGEVAPLMAMISQQIVGEDHVVATVGSVEDDPYGRVLRQAHFLLTMNTPWLQWAMDAAVEHFQLNAGHIVAWGNRTGLFGDGALLSDGVEAWFQGDHVKAVHVLVPQIERGFRSLMGVVGRPTTKPHPKFKGAQVAVTMGDGLYSADTVAALGQHGPDLAVHLATLYADPRGPNLRNEVAHGLLSRDQMQEGTVLWLIQTILLLGLWRAPAPADATTGPERSGKSI